MREDIRTRKMFTMLANTKSLKIRTDKIDVPDASSISIEMFKPQDKKMLIDLFCNDKVVQQKCEQIITALRRENEDLIQDFNDPSALVEKINLEDNFLSE